MGDYFTSINESLKSGTQDPYSLSEIIVSWAVGVPVLFLSVFLIITLIGPGQLPKSIRIVLINIQVAVIVFTVMGLFTATLFLLHYDCLHDFYQRSTDNSNSSLNQLRYSINDTSDTKYQMKEMQSDSMKCTDTQFNIILSYDILVIYGQSTMVSIRLVFMAFYGVLVYIYIRYVFYKIKVWVVVVSCVAVWMMSILINIPIVGLLFVPHSSVHTNAIITECLGFVIPLAVALPAISIAIVLPIRALFFINKVTSNVRNVSYGKAIAKLVLLQLIVNTMLLIGHIIVFIPIIVYTETIFMSDPDVNNVQQRTDSLAATILGFLLEMTSLIVSPILFIIFLKHVRDNAKKILNCKSFNSKGTSIHC